MAMGLSAVGCGAVGWLMGPFAGNAAFGIWYRRLGPEIAGVSAVRIFYSVFATLCHREQCLHRNKSVVKPYTDICAIRKKKSSTNVSNATEPIPRASPWPTRCQTTTEKRSAVCKVTDNG